MYECPNCSANLRFDIPSGKLACDSCGSKFDPYSISKESDAEETTEYEVTVFTCPQCGGEVYSTDTMAAGFCSFCGASTILSSRLQKERRPSFIIPFRKTKEDCIKAYMKLMRQAIYAPSVLRNEKNINGFRGIYMPYWVYYVTQGPDVKLPICSSHREGDYTIYMHYMLQMDMDNHYKGLSFDASSSFADSISEKLGPYDVKNMKAFTPAFLSGFYADTSDLDESLYRSDAETIAAHRTLRYIIQNCITDQCKPESKKDELLKSLFSTQTKTVDGAMFPVWFLAYRVKDRVAYATVNGQTGKIVADLPVDLRKYLFGSVMLAVPIFFLLNAFVTMTPGSLLMVIGLMSAWITLQYSAQMRYIAAKENGEDDRGLLAHLRRKALQRLQGSQAAPTGRVKDADLVSDVSRVKDQVISDQMKETLRDGLLDKQKNALAAFVLYAVMFFGMFSMPNLTRVVFSDLLRGAGAERIVMVACLVLIGVSYFRCHARSSLVVAKKGIEGTFFILFGMTVATIVSVFHPVSDYYYYGCVILLLLAIVAALLDLVSCYNILATRPLPQYSYGEKPGSH